MTQEIRVLTELRLEIERVVLAAPRRRRSRWRWRPLAVLALLVLGGATGALAAAGVFQAGSPVAPDVPATPRAGYGVAIPASVRLLGLRVVDPGGGPPWGLRLDRTTRGFVCVQPGRVAFGHVGALGIDGALDNDGRFHAFSDNYLEDLGCSASDAHGHAFVAVGLWSLPASAIEYSCIQRGSHATGRERCPEGSVRNIAYGMLGPDAVSITYVNDAGRFVAEPTAGPDGAFLVIRTAPTACTPLLREPIGNCGGGAAVGTVLGPDLLVRTVTYRDGRVCRLPTAFEGPSEVCAPVGYAAPAVRAITPAQVATRVTVGRPRPFCEGGAHGPAPCSGKRAPDTYAVPITFIARVAVRDVHSGYEIAVQYPGGTPGCPLSLGSGPIAQDVVAGQRVYFTDYEPAACTRPLHGWISYKTGNTTVPVGRFTIQLPPTSAP